MRGVDCEVPASSSLHYNFDHSYGYQDHHNPYLGYKHQHGHHYNDIGYAEGYHHSHGYHSATGFHALPHPYPQPAPLAPEPHPYAGAAPLQPAEPLQPAAPVAPELAPEVHPPPPPPHHYHGYVPHPLDHVQGQAY